MKKLVTYLLLVVSFAVLYACDAPHQHTYGEWESNEEGHYRPYTCGCEGNEELTAHEVNDDGLCGVCGYDVSHEHTYGEWMSTEEGHYRPYTCGCEGNEAMSAHNDDEGDSFCDICRYQDMETFGAISDMLKSAYADSIKYAFDSVDLDEVRVVDYHGKFGNVYLAKVVSSYLKYPNNVYSEFVSSMRFSYNSANCVYIFCNNTLYTAKQAYEENLIDFNMLCKLYGMNMFGFDTFSEENYNKIKAYFVSKNESIDSYNLEKYYGEYNGYSAVTYYPLDGMPAAVTVYDDICNLQFAYGTISQRIYFFNATNEYSMGDALENGVITKEDLYDIFELHTGSEEVNEELINMMITPAYELCMKYKDDFAKVPEFSSFHLTEYYGKYGDSYIFGLNSDYFGNLVSATEEEKELMRYGNFSGEYVLNNGKLYTLEQALEAGIITEEIKQDVMIKYYS